ncbi:unnamed protein product, partial [Prorocentrum cordatum]
LLGRGAGGRGAGSGQPRAAGGGDERGPRKEAVCDGARPISEDGDAAAAGVPGGSSPVNQNRRRSGTLDDLDHNPEVWGTDENVMDHVGRWRHDQQQAHESKGASMGIWQGVIFPCMANILGVILFLRLPWIVGKAGVVNGFCLVFVCCCCTFITSLSLSAVATNGKMRGGGSYYLISRSLGAALGAGVGLCFYMANSIGAAMYFMGTVEAWEVAAPNLQLLTAGELNNVRATGFLILAVALLVVGGGIKYVARVGTVFLFIVLVVIFFMYLGIFIGPSGNGEYELDIVDAKNEIHTETLAWNSPSRQYLTENLWPDYDADQKAFPLDTVQYSFIPLMSLWFPACTGIMAGSNRSADLEDPASYIPKGTIFAQVVTSLIYLSFTILYGCVAPRQTLLDDKFFAASSAWPIKEVVVYGVIASTIGAGLTSLTSGTRLLSAIAMDKTLPVLAVFAVKPGEEPRLALVASGALCACAIAIGQLNAIAPVLTMFFLICYTCVNMSCTVLELVGDPNWRPRFPFHHWSVSLIGTVLCLFMMFAMDPLIATVAVFFCAIVFSYASFNSAEAKWGDGFQGMKFQVAKKILTKMDLHVHAKNWRPQLLVITKASIVEDAQTNNELVQVHDPQLLKFVSQLKGGRGFVIVGGICCNSAFEDFVEGASMFSGLEKFTVSDGQVAMQKLLNEYGISGFGRVIYTHDFQKGVLGLVQNAGLGSFQPNSIIASWPREWRSLKEEGELARTHLIRLVQTSFAHNKVTLVLKGHMWPTSLVRLGGYIDIWWIVGNGSILLLLPHLLKKHRVWRECRTRLWVLAEKEADDPEKLKKELKQYVTEFRLDMEVHVKIVDPDTLNFEGEATLPGGDSFGLTREISGASSERDNFELKRDFSGGSTMSREAADGITRWISNQTAVGGVSAKVRPTREGSQEREFALRPPGSTRAHTGDASTPAFAGQGATTRSSSKGAFLHSKDQLASTKPLSAAELLIPRGLNQLIVSASREAELVVTNLPEMSKTESSLGYFQFVASMTKDLPRVVLVRGTNAEVITAFT